MTEFPAILERPRRRLIGGVVAFALVRAAGAAMAAFSTREIFGVLGGRSAELSLAPLAVLAASGAIIAVSRISEGVLAERLGQNFSHSLRSLLFDHISRLPASFVRDQRQGGLALRFVGDLGAIRGWVSKGLTRLISAPIVLLCTFLALCALDLRLGLVAMLPVVAGLAMIYVASGWSAPFYSQLRGCRARLSADMTERAAIAPELRLLGRMRREQHLLAEKSRRLTGAAVRKAAAAGAIRAVPDLISGIAAALVLATAVLAGLPTATAAGALAAVALMISPLRDLAGVADRYRGWAVARQKSERLLGMEPAGALLDTAPRRPRARTPGLSFRSVCHGPLEGFNLEIGSGERAAIVGDAGLCNTSILTLAAGLDHPSAGRVLVDGVAATALPHKYRSTKVALLGSRSPILSGSLRRALTLGLPRRPSDDRILSIARMFELDEVLERLGGLGGRVSEGGRNLSVGEVWRILMARLNLGAFELILIDTPEAALDRNGVGLLAAELQRRPSTVLLATGSPDLAHAMGLRIRTL